MIKRPRTSLKSPKSLKNTTFLGLKPKVVAKLWNATFNEAGIPMEARQKFKESVLERISRPFMGKNK